MKYKILSGTLLLVGYALSSEAYAVCTQSNFTPQDVSMAVGRVVVRPSDAVGAVLRRAVFPMNRVSDAVVCDRGAPDTVTNTLVQNYPLSGLGDSIYTTNIEGIGIRLYREVTSEVGSSFSGYYPYTRTLASNTRYDVGNGNFIVEIIKIAPSTGSGALVPGRYSSYYLTKSPDRPLLTSSVYGNAITIASSSCEIRGQISQVVNLPTVNKVDFRGVGTTQGERDFNLNILCNGGGNSTSVIENNNISLSFDYNLVPNTTNVIENAAPAATKANGVGVQLVSKYQNSDRIVVKGEKIPLGSVNSNQTIEYNVPMLARYYQTEQNVSAGRVSSVSTVTINYD
ncbi:fimbrial protein [Acinetobacter shaoyimingii]|uniref:Type 1 fimbrial protein n=1 Tax=Acinetobacter shaoyimingii TaxID=2715164 RepID=A0A6G8RV88_9GAMM|nr:fimbrial protein [Acinetobacter shaoyimingii]QIO05801.1 type 1 fimbrial protein [Acinetobacter shaoyimingii]